MTSIFKSGSQKAHGNLKSLFIEMVTKRSVGFHRVTKRSDLCEIKANICSVVKSGDRLENA